MTRNLFCSLILGVVVLAPTVRAQDDWGMMKQMQQAIENNPQLRADRDRNVERIPVCPDSLNAAAKNAGTDAHAWLVIGRCASKQNDPKLAEAAFRKTVDLQPTAEADSLLAMALVNERELKGFQEYSAMALA